MLCSRRTWRGGNSFTERRREDGFDGQCNQKQVREMNRPVVLSIAGLDPSGGAGIVADIKTIAALGCFPAAALTSITFQNTTGVFGVENQTAKTLRAQVEPIVQDLELA